MPMGISIGLDLETLNLYSKYDPIRALGDDLYDDWSAAENVSITNGKVSSWASRKNNWTLSQAVQGQMPAFSETSLNGRPGVTPDGLDDFLEAAGVFGLPIGANPVEMWFLMSQPIPGSETTNATFAMYGETVNNGRRVIRVGVAGVSRARVTSGNGTASITSSNTVSVLDGINVVRGIITPTQIQVRVNGQPDTNPSAVVSATNSTRIRFFSTTALTPGAFGRGTFNRIIFTKPLSDEKATKLTQFLMSQGGIS